MSFVTQVFLSLKKRHSGGRLFETQKVFNLAIRFRDEIQGIKKQISIVKKFIK